MKNIYSSLTELLEDIATAIREKSEGQNLICARDIPTAILNIPNEHHVGLISAKHVDIASGYVSNGTWTIGGDTTSYSDVYYVEKDVPYLIMLGQVVGTRFRIMFSNSNVVLEESDVTGVSVANFSNPDPYENVVFTPSENGYLTITKDNNGVSGIKCFVFDIPKTIYSKGKRTKKVHKSGSVADGSIRLCVSKSAQCISERQFAECSQLSYVSFPTCKSIYARAFYNCKKLQTVSFPACKNICSYAFADCDSLPYIDLPECETISNHAFSNCHLLSQVNIPKLQNLGAEVFVSCWNLKSCDLSLLTEIPYETFKNCSGLKYVNAPLASVLSVSAFMNAVMLESVNCPQCNSIDSYALFNTGIESASFSLCTLISHSAFAHCSKLLMASFPMISSIYGAAFRECGRLTSAYFPNCSEIGGLAFSGCSALTTIDLHNIEKIGAYAFNGCQNLTAITLEKLSYIEYGAFNSCYRLMSVYVLTSQCPVIYRPEVFDRRVFESTPMEQPLITGSYGSIYVLSSMVSIFKAANEWSVYANRITSLEF